jgi:hypothetical protein
MPLAIQLATAMVDKRIATARAYPRSIARFKQQTAQLLSEDVETAISAEYAKPVGNGYVHGPSIRLAELAAMCWGNLEVEVGEPIVNERNVFVQATAWDLQNNFRMDGTATMSIIDKYGQRYKPHMIETTCAAVASKARRNAIISVIPRAYINDLLQVARDVARKNLPTVEQQRAALLDFFAKQHRIIPDQIFKAVAVQGVEDITQEHITLLRGIAQALKEGSKPDEFFEPVATAAQQVKDRLAEAQARTRGSSLPEPKPEQKPADAKPPAGKNLLVELMSELEAASPGALVKFFENHNLTEEDITNAKATKAKEYAAMLQAAIVKAKEPKA